MLQSSGSCLVYRKIYGKQENQKNRKGNKNEEKLNEEERCFSKSAGIDMNEFVHNSLNRNFPAVTEYLKRSQMKKNSKSRFDIGKLNA